MEGPLANLVQLKSSVEQYEVKLKKNENDLEKIRKEIEPYQAEYDVRLLLLLAHAVIH